MAIPDTGTEKSETLMGVDVGATLAKLAVRGADGSLDFSFLPASDLPTVARRIEDRVPGRIGLTGCGATALEARLGAPCFRFLEFEAWGRGSRHLLEAQGFDPGEPYLLVSLGTGTSILLVEGDAISRVGGTALGGGTVLGLGAALTGLEDHDAICRLAQDGERRHVDLRVGDIYQENEIPLPAETTAASFGKVLHRAPGASGSKNLGPGRAPGHEDLAAAVMGLVGENVALICAGLGRASGIKRLVYGGGALHDNPVLVSILLGVSAGMGAEPVLLENGNFAGALGVLEAAATG